MQTVTTMKYANGVATVTTTAPQPGTSSMKSAGDCAPCGKGLTGHRVKKQTDADRAAWNAAMKQSTEQE